MNAVPYAINSRGKLFSRVGADDISNQKSGNVGIGTNQLGVEKGAGKYLTVAASSNVSSNNLAAIEIQGKQWTTGQPIGRLDFISNAAPGNSAILRMESRTSGGAQSKGDLAFFTKHGNTFATSALQERLTIKTMAKWELARKVLRKNYL